MMAPPPTPNSPESRPVHTPPSTMTAASMAISPAGRPDSIRVSGEDQAEKSGGGLRQFGPAVQDQAQRLTQHSNTSISLHTLRGEMPPEGARARHRTEEPEDMPRDVVHPRA